MGCESFRRGLWWAKETVRGGKDRWREWRKHAGTAKEPKKKDWLGLAGWEVRKPACSGSGCCFCVCVCVCTGSFFGLGDKARACVLFGRTVPDLPTQPLRHKRKNSLEEQQYSNGPATLSIVNAIVPC